MKTYTFFIIAFVLLAACGPATVLQTDSSKPIDLSGRWNATDAEISSNQIYNALLNSDWLKEYKAGINYTPFILVEAFKNDMDNNLFNEQLVNYFKQYINNNRQFNLLKEDNTNIPYLTLNGKLSAENFEQSDKNGINYTLTVYLMNTEGELLWSEDNNIKKFIKD